MNNRYHTKDFWVFRAATGSNNRSMATIVVIALLLIVGFTWRFYEMFSGGFGPPFSNVMVVTSAPVQTETVEQVYETSASLLAERQAPVNAKTFGQVTAILVHEGDSVSAGQVLFKIDPSKQAASVSQATSQSASQVARQAQSSALTEQAQASLKQAQSAYQLSQSEWTRYQKLYQGQFISELELEQKATARRQAEAAYLAALEQVRAAEAASKAAQTDTQASQAAVRLSQAGYADTVVRAPFSGLLSQRQVDMGQYVVTDQPLATVVDPSSLEVVFSVPERYASQLKTGLPVTVTLEGQATSYRATVRFVDPMVDAKNRSITVKARFQTLPSRLVSGQSARIKLVLNQHPHAVVIPEEALVERGDEVFVYIRQPVTAQPDEEKPASPYIAQIRLVKVGERLPGKIEILSGLEAGEQVITGGLQKLDDQTPVMEASEMPASTSPEP